MIARRLTDSRALARHTFEREYPAHQRTVYMQMHPESDEMVVTVIDHTRPNAYPEEALCTTMQEARFTARRMATAPRHPRITT